MKFYKLMAKIEAGNEVENDRQARIERRKRICRLSTEFNEGLRDSYCFISDMEGGELVAGMIVTGATNPRGLFDGFATYVGIRPTEVSESEITLSGLENLLSCASRMSFIEDDDNVLERFRLDLITGRYSRSLVFGENLTEVGVGKAGLVEEAGRYFMNETLLPELDRIYTPSRGARTYGHPVHYIIETDNRDTRREVYRILLSALFENGRLRNRRYAYLDFHPGDRYSTLAYDALYKSCEGGAIVVRYLADGDTEDGDACAEMEMIENICEMARTYRNRVLTVICLPRVCGGVKASLYENLGTMSFVEVREDFISGEEIGNLFRRLASEHGVRVDKRLFCAVDTNRTYLATELQDVFEEWYNEKLRRSVYSQYKDFAVARHEVMKSAPKGTAYDELQELIGLGAAKEVIAKALNFYKMQALYAERGIRQDTPAMHMIFTGNPGTAKTTVARLFARIMRENGLLERGHLIEVGRGDLVGKYTGWTAQTVQAKFRAAKGGVLFVDEAYSLVDDRDGSFGDEAINTIVQEMENHRGETVVIFAGYPDKMKKFLAKNPGLRSRIAFHVPFADYDDGELCQIARLIGRKNGMSITDGAMERLGQVFAAARANSDFGNGRYVRTVFEQARMNQASRLLGGDFTAITAEEICTITAEDITLPDCASVAQSVRVGFV